MQNLVAAHHLSCISLNTALQVGTDGLALALYHEWFSEPSGIISGPWAPSSIKVTNTGPLTVKMGS